MSQYAEISYYYHNEMYIIIIMRYHIIIVRYHIIIMRCISLQWALFCITFKDQDVLPKAIMPKLHSDYCDDRG